MVQTSSRYYAILIGTEKCPWTVNRFKGSTDVSKRARDPCPQWTSGFGGAHDGDTAVPVRGADGIAMSLASLDFSHSTFTWGNNTAYFVDKSRAHPALARHVSLFGAQHNLQVKRKFTPWSLLKIPQGGRGAFRGILVLHHDDPTFLLADLALLCTPSSTRSQTSGQRISHGGPPPAEPHRVGPGW